ncbi:MAG: MBL fold metallo-hydrolase [Rhodobacterales bacterium]|nr:MBL fold metallo-hydrolase [Rhodobacterales bacterium]
MKLTRRSLLRAGSAALAAGALAPALPRRLWAGSTLTLGQMQVQTLSDGMLVLPGDFILGGMPQEEMRAVMAKHGLSPDRLEAPVNVTLMRDGTNTVLFDVGSGPDFMPTAGKLMEAFEAAGVTPDEVTHVLFTHAHPDHLWGLLDDFDEPLFPNAEFVMGQTEFDYWMNPETVNTIGQARTTFAIGAKRRLEVIAEQIRLVADGDEVLPGVAAVLTAGHTPGHLAWELRSGSAAAMVLGDCIGNPHVGFERPDWASGSDQDPAMAAQTRLRLLDRLAGEQMPIVGYHLPQGGVGRAERADGTYRFVAEV